MFEGSKIIKKYWQKDKNIFVNDYLYFQPLNISQMIKKQQPKVVQFTNLPEDHKLEFIQFLIKNNICFQEGKQNCVAKVQLKNVKAKTINNQSNQMTTKESKKIKQNTNKSLQIQQEGQESKQLKGRISIINRQINHKNNSKVLKTPRKQELNQLKPSSLSLNKHSRTAKKNQILTPNKIDSKLKETVSLSAVNQSKLTPKSHSKTMIQQNNQSNQKQTLMQNEKKQSAIIGNQKEKIKKKKERERQKVVNKYSNLFDLGQKARPLKWPHNILERTIQQIYDDMFIRNNQLFQSKNLNHAFKTLIQISFSQIVETYFYKKFKGSKLATTNLNNMLYSLSYYSNKDNCSIFFLTFQNFLLGQLQAEDLVYYLFTRNILKKQLRISEKSRDIGRNFEGTYFIQNLKGKDINRILKRILGLDAQLIREYRDLVICHMVNQQIPAYDFLRILVQDYHLKRSNNKLGISCRQSFGNTLIENQCSYQCKNTQQLTFGEDHEDHENQHDEDRQKYSQFWNCLDYSHIRDSLFQLIMEKMNQKVNQLLEILIIDIDKAPEHHLTNLNNLLYKKSQSLVKAVFEMNKMKWFKQLSITNPSQLDMNLVESIQIRLRQLRQNPSGRQIGQFCKNILTTNALVNELQLSLLVND